MKNDTSLTNFRNIVCSLTKKRYIILFFIILLVIIIVVYLQTINKDASMKIELDIVSIEPKDSSLNSTVKIFFRDVPKEQDKNIICNCSETLYEGETQVIVIDNVTHGYFTLLLDMNGKWNNTNITLRVKGKDREIESFSIMANSSPVSYNIPKDVSDKSYFRIGNII